MKAFPRLLDVTSDPGFDALTPEQYLAVAAHTMLDEGADVCPSCEEIVPKGRFCGCCGVSLFGSSPVADRRDRECGGCGTSTRQTFCEGCGLRVVPLMIERLEKGQTTMSAEVAKTTRLNAEWIALKKKRGIRTRS